MTAEDFMDLAQMWFPGAEPEAHRMAAEICAKVKNDPTVDARDEPGEVIMHLMGHAHQGNQLAENLLRNIRKAEA